MMEMLPSGTILHGRYRVERALGSGGFGHVYLAVDLKTNQQFAIKEYLVAGSSGQAQLEHEARVLSGLHHANLPLFQEAFNERGRYYVALSYIEGSDLTDYIRVAQQRNDAIPLVRIMTWMLSICDAVIFLHSQQQYVIHRDIKPDNIRITSNGTAILVDMGNAKATADGARTLFFIRHQGTPGYAPPEQYPGGSGTDVRSDVYALGGTLYFALTTHEPPSVSTRNQSLQQGQPDLPSLQELLTKNPPEESAEAKGARQFRLGVSKPAKPAPRHSRHLAQLTQLPPELLDRLNRIIKRAMAMKPKERYQSVAELSHDLRSVMAALPTQQTQASSARPKNPYSTEPELPLYESMQAAKENKEKQQASPGPQSGAPPSPSSTKDASATPPAQPSPTPVSPTPIRCPRCNTALTPQAVFCPKCGLPLTNMPRTNTATRPPVEPTDNPSPQNKAPEHDISRDETMVIIPPPQAQAAPGGPTTGTAMSPEPMHRPFLSPNVPTASQDISRVHAPMQNQHVVSRPTPFLQNASSRGGNTHPPSTTGFRMQPRTIIIAAVIFVVLLIALILILFAATRPRDHTPRGSEYGPRYYIEAQVPSHEQIISLYIA